MIGERRQPFLAWPGWPHLRFAGKCMLLVSAWFALVYVGTDRVEAHHSFRVRVFFDAELRMPFVPAFTVFYMSIYSLFIAAPFVLRTRGEIWQLVVAQSLAILIGGIGFLLIPAQSVYPPPTEAVLGVWKDLFRFADRINLDYNFVPSLHVALSVICIEFFARTAGLPGRIALRFWAALIAASTLLTHQHYVMDVVTGWLLAWAVVRFARRTSH